jgi:hypothetical protein
MSYNNGPKVITNGLLTYFDAGNQDSYPGTGTTWTDLTRSTYNGALTATFSSSDSGRFDFNGSTSRCLVGTYASSILPTNSFTYEVWCRPNSTINLPAEANSGTNGLSTQKTVLGPQWYNTNSGAGISVGTNGICVLEHGNGYLPAILVATTAVSNTFTSQVVVVYTNKQPSLYINGAFVKVGLTSTKTLVYGDWGEIGNGSYSPFNGSISIVKAYNRVLTASEITQNYNAIKGRFRL